MLIKILSLVPFLISFNGNTSLASPPSNDDGLISNDDNTNLVSTNTSTSNHHELEEDYEKLFPLDNHQFDYLQFNELTDILEPDIFYRSH